MGVFVMLLEEYFEVWELILFEMDVVMLVVKGFLIVEIVEF